MLIVGIPLKCSGQHRAQRVKLPDLHASPDHAQNTSYCCFYLNSIIRMLDGGYSPKNRIRLLRTLLQRPHPRTVIDLWCH